MTEDIEDTQTPVDGWFHKTYEEFEELTFQRMTEAIEEGLPTSLLAMASVAVYIGLLTKLAHHTGLPHESVDRMLKHARKVIVTAHAN